MANKTGCSESSALDRAIERVAGGVLSVQVLLAVVHQVAPTLEQVRAGVGGLDLVPNDMRQRRLDDLARVIGLLGRPVPE